LNERLALFDYFTDWQYFCPLELVIQKLGQNFLNLVELYVDVVMLAHNRSRGGRDVDFGLRADFRLLFRHFSIKKSKHVQIVPLLLEHVDDHFPVLERHQHRVPLVHVVPTYPKPALDRAHVVVKLIRGDARVTDGLAGFRGYLGGHVLGDHFRDGLEVRIRLLVDWVVEADETNVSLSVPSGQ